MPPSRSSAPVASSSNHAGTSMALARLGEVAKDKTGGKIPAFLQKLYAMVDSPETNHLIYWSEDGTSFFVPNHEAFGKELLPRFFKHSNFSSFVRQLNMYGFHKVPHMQQGVLEPNSSSELWEFTNPNFQRDQQHLLPLVTRKKAIHPTIETPDGETEVGGPSSSGGGAAGSSKVDVPGILNSIATIRAQQTALSADLKELQQSNQHLWTEALAARERHKAHQDTTDRILRFLAGVFGQGAAGDIASGGGNVAGAVRAAKESLNRSGLATQGGPPPTSGIVRNRGLMIQEANPDQTLGDLNTALGVDEPLEEISASRFQEVSPTPTPTSTAILSPNPQSTALVPRTPMNNDLSQYFNFPAQPQAGPSSSASTQVPTEAFTPNFLADFASAVGPFSPSTLNSMSMSTPNSQALEKSYQSADAISNEVDTLQASIEELVASLGLAGDVRPDGTWDPPNAENVSDVANQYTGGDFDMETFLSDLTGSASKSADSSLSGSPKPVDTPDATFTTTPNGSAPVDSSLQTDWKSAPTRSSKRKSDVASLDPQLEPDVKNPRLD